MSRVSVGVRPSGAVRDLNDGASSRSSIGVALLGKLKQPDGGSSE